MATIAGTGQVVAAECLANRPLGGRARRSQSTSPVAIRLSHSIARTLWVFLFGIGEAGLPPTCSAVAAGENSVCTMAGDSGPRTTPIC